MRRWKDYGRVKVIDVKSESHWKRAGSGIWGDSILCRFECLFDNEVVLSGKE